MKPDLHLQDEIFAIVGDEIARKEFHPGPMARAVAESQGNGEWVQGLYIKFRVEELYRRAEREAATAAKAAAVAARVEAKAVAIAARVEAKKHFGRDLAIFLAIVIGSILAGAAWIALVVVLEWVSVAPN